jgi:hypothetical protein
MRFSFVEAVALCTAAAGGSRPTAGGILTFFTTVPALWDFTDITTRNSDPKTRQFADF